MTADPEKEINLLVEKSLQEAENLAEIPAVKKKYLERGGLISQFFQQLGQEKNPNKKKKMGGLINN